MAPPTPPSGWQRGRPVEMRWMDVGRVLEAAFRVYRLFWKTLLGIAAIVMAPIAVATAILTAVSIRRLEELGAEVQANPGDSVDVGPLLVFGLVFLAILLVQFLILQPLLTAATIRVVSVAAIGRIPTMGDALRFAGRRFGSILWVIVLTALVIIAVVLVTLVAGIFLADVDESLTVVSVLLMLAAIVFSIVLFNRFLLAPQVVVIENLRGPKALGRSSRLVRGKGWMVFGTNLVATILAGVATTAITTIPNQLARSGGPLAQSLAGLATVGAQILTIPFTVSVLVFLYLSMRVRVEGLTTWWLEQDILAREARR